MVSAAKPELPNELVIEIGFFATDWAVIEQEIQLDTAFLADKGLDGLPVVPLKATFRDLRQNWYRLARERHGPEWHQDLRLLNDRLARRAEARGYALHGVWSVVGPRQYQARWLVPSTLKMDMLETTYDQLREQSDKLRDLRCDLVEFFRKVYGETSSSE